MDKLITELRQTNETILALAEQIQKDREHTNSNTQRVTFNGLGGWGAAAVCACFITYLTMILFAIIIVPEIHDLKAWKDIHSAKIARLEAAQEHKP